MIKNDLFDFMQSITREMGEEYERIQKRARQDPGTAGDQGEENWATLFKDWLPSTFQVVTKGRILGADGTASPQVDVIILKPEYPKNLLDKKLYLAGGVVAAFECKLTLKKNHITEALKTSKIIKNLVQKREGTPYSELHSPIIYGLLTHSHCWKGPNSKPTDNIQTTLEQYDKACIAHPREMLDVVCVSDLAIWEGFKYVFTGPGYTGWEGYVSKLFAVHGFSNGAATTAYTKFSYEYENQIKEFTPIGTLITFLFRKLAWENPSIRSLSEYFARVKLSGVGQGDSRMWDPFKVYSADTLRQIQLGKLTNGIAWDEWSMGF
ncbi:DUF6602 domain-containing protein [Priestia filamentosa]|uniref:DUF6602 domain-containing protein n=1 Tax=Priestia filamentosa TaxID=1402861 RepID=UPI0039825F8E